MPPSQLAEKTDFYRLDVNRKLNPDKRSKLGQFMTPAPIARFMAGLFSDISRDVSLLDPGGGVGSLTAAFVDEVLCRNRLVDSLRLTAYEVDPLLHEYLQDSLESCLGKGNTVSTIPGVATVHDSDFIECATKVLQGDLLSPQVPASFTHVLMNPPYKKINSHSSHRKMLRAVGIETSNLYTAFVALAIRLLQPGGEIVAIIPRSFCNGPYFRPFRELLLSEIAIKRVHIFETRNRAFKEDSVLQENIILHGVKGQRQRDVIVSGSHTGAFVQDDETNAFVSEDLTTRIVSAEAFVVPGDKEKFIHVAPSSLSEGILKRVHAFRKSLTDLGLEISTGPVVDFRLKEHLRSQPEKNTVPLLYARHFSDGEVTWPVEGKKANAIEVNDATRKWLMKNNGYFVVTRRFTSKEERKRIVANVYPGNLPGDWIGYENHLNVFHHGGEGIEEDLARGLAAFLNSTLLDTYFREFSGHTQVNATDLRSLGYPPRDFLIGIGRKVNKKTFSQDEIDSLLEQELQGMIDSNDNDPLRAQQKITEALSILKALGLPRGQHNERSALTLLAILNLSPESRWKDAEAPLIGITPIMEFCERMYGKSYAPNTRETFRRQTMHQFVDGAIALYNPDDPTRPVNSPKACYQISPDALDVILTYGSEEWDERLKSFLSVRKTLAEQYAKEREMTMIPVKVGEGKEISLTPGEHSKLISDIITEFAPRYAPGSEVVYVGDTGDKIGFFREDFLKELGVEVDRHGKMPDVVLYFREKDWLLLIEAVTSHGPVDAKRHAELATLFAGAKPGLVYVTTFPTRATMGAYLPEISWETEVWVAEAPTHMIHFDGERFLGPYKSATSD